MIPMETMLVATIGRIPLTISSVIPGIGGILSEHLGNPLVIIWGYQVAKRRICWGHHIWLHSCRKLHLPLRSYQPRRPLVRFHPKRP